MMSFVNTEFIDFTVQHQEFWITWFGGVIHVGFGDQTNPFMWCNYVREENILCGYNAAWVKTEGAKIPQNAFIAGTSEVRQEPLYIGRAEHDGCLINGKIHVIHGTCFLPYYGEEIVVYSYEILVVPDVNFRGTLADVACTINL
ncbi:hypothetical protein MSG28_010822 [Choristoneura fumiferana]|uniref:Uncharacterized protein n=1 Tax=Choristoneura fumiferana TaxID=7141 RepID=A0ACC0KPD5_CHOFU|nr:hypothetical protein MSG28_010822 [Choristoneura fumiferana]